MRLRFLIRYSIRAAIRMVLVISSRSLEALSVGAANIKAFIESSLAYLLALIYAYSTRSGLSSALEFVEASRGLRYTPITKSLIVNTIVPTIRALLTFIALVYLFRYTYSTDLSQAYAGLALSIVALLVGILAGNEPKLSSRPMVLIIVSFISSIHTYYYATHMLEPYRQRLLRIDSVLVHGKTHVPVERLRSYVREMRVKDPNFRSRLTLSQEIRKLGRVAALALIGSILSIILAISVAYVSYILSIRVFEYSVYRSISSAVEIGQPEMFFVFIARLASLLYIYSLRYSGILKE